MYVSERKSDARTDVLARLLLIDSPNCVCPVTEYNAMTIGLDESKAIYPYGFVHQENELSFWVVLNQSGHHRARNHRVVQGTKADTASIVALKPCEAVSNVLIRPDRV